MKSIASILLALAVVIAGLFAVTQSTIPQVIPMGLICLASIIGVLDLKKWTYSGGVFDLIVTIVAVTYFIIRAIFSPVFSLGLKDLLLIVAVSNIYLLYRCWLKEQKYRWPIIWAVIVLMLVNFLMLIPSANAWRDNLLGYAKGSVFTGLYNHHNFFGNLMMISSLMCLTLLLFHHVNRLYKLSYLLLFAGGMTSIILAESRGSYAGFLLGAIALFVSWVIIKGEMFWHKNKLTIIGVAAVAILGGVVVSLGGVRVLEKRQLGASAEAESSLDGNNRSAYFAMAIDQIVDAPILGSGSRSHEYKSYQYWSSSLYKNVLDHTFVHNEFLQAFTDYGLIGMILVIIFICIRLKQSVYSLVNSRMINSNRLTLSLAGLAMLLSMVVHMFVSFPAHCFPNIVICAVFCAYVTNTLSKKDSKTLSAYRYRGKLSAIFVLGSSLVGCWLLKLEVPAAIAFAKQGIYADDQNWHPAAVNRESWQVALEDASVHSPSYDRFNKLGNLYLMKAEKLNGSARTQLRAKALECFLKSKKLHAEEPISRLNIANILFTNRQFKAAEREFIEVEKYAKDREYWFGYYRKRAAFYGIWAKTKERSLSNDKIIDLYEKAIESSDASLKHSHFSRHIEWVKPRSRILLNYSKYLESIGEKQRSEDMFDQYLAFGREYFSGKKYVNEFNVYSEELVKRCYLAGQARDIKRHMFLLRLARFMIVKQQKVNTEAQNKHLQQMYNYVINRYKDMQKAGFK